MRPAMWLLLQLAVALELHADDECTESCALSALQQSAKSLAAPLSLPAIGDGPEARYSKEDLVLLLELHQKRMNTSERWGSSNPVPAVGHFNLASSCYGFTGGTCTFQGCDSYRMAQCNSGKCMCPNGCAGADGRCYPTPNLLVSTKFLLSNFKYDSYRMYFKRVTTWGQMGTSNMPSFTFMGADYFDLYRVPGLFKGQPLFMLASHKWPSYVLAIRATTGTAFSPFGTYAVELKDTSAPWKPEDIMLRVCDLTSHGQPGAVQIGSAGAVRTVWAYVHHGSWSVYGSMTSPGDGGAWVPTPHLPPGAIPPC